MSNQNTPDTETAQDADPALSAEEQLQAEVEQLRAELEQTRADVLRERADLENQRKRVSRDIDHLRKFANEKLLGEMLPVFDSLDAGLSAAGDTAGPLRDGMELTLKQLLKVAGDNGLRMLDPLGETFNPEFHQAVSQAEAPEGATPGQVLQVFQKGFVLNDRLLRPALVVVARQD
ncbi:nucleotide exchange factor GrpE [Pseudoxanthomonas kalamensis DSM 18571]|uniref:nucleotide exchange factor GrpE n=1 Tax=Pseudoxanthomonas kalamensis TaxID=289483 RepID=UPI001391D7B2|nr:nucleotide exchange factor GrpE [Pseudoxanthomonas kalamensis]KAF1709870.1 nucleotide exchange factor GrpE [Pseudoxanthomonas kalamensis DSM 18571]